MCIVEFQFMLGRASKSWNSKSPALLLPAQPHHMNTPLYYLFRRQVHAHEIDSEDIAFREDVVLTKERTSSAAYTQTRLLSPNK